MPALQKKPLVATPTSAYRKAISHGDTGFLAETPAEWIECLDILINQPKTREQVGNKAYEHVCENYTYKHVAEHYARFFQDIKHANKTNRHTSNIK